MRRRTARHCSPSCVSCEACMDLYASLPLRFLLTSHPPPPLPFPFTLLYLLLIDKFQALKSSCYRALVVIRGGGIDGANKTSQRPTPENKAQTPTQPSSSSSFLQRLGPTHGSLEKGRVGESALKTTPGRLQNHFINNLHYESPNKVLYTCHLSFFSFFLFSSPLYCSFLLFPLSYANRGQHHLMTKYARSIQSKTSLEITSRMIHWYYSPPSLLPFFYLLPLFPSPSLFSLHPLSCVSN